MPTLLVPTASIKASTIYNMIQSQALDPLVFQSVQQVHLHYCGSQREVIHNGKYNLARCVSDTLLALRGPSCEVEHVQLVT
jgi:hypothetical protein